ncbi:hypothetical protein B0T17DRAFT_68940 [Bombardia bombarda]|uniref:Uncharacterized protein n=1 Tax=Bombardia bombarda TaxID=252184 RepID=A0AA39XLA9_9PEZI|nr:hypothetical protein B0T17DRAFT_68940 [Bombardia bombarda]
MILTRHMYSNRHCSSSIRTSSTPTHQVSFELPLCSTQLAQHHHRINQAHPFARFNPSPTCVNDTIPDIMADLVRVGAWADTASPSTFSCEQFMQDLNEPEPAYIRTGAITEWLHAWEQAYFSPEGPLGSPMRRFCANLVWWTHHRIWYGRLCGCRMA